MDSSLVTKVWFIETKPANKEDKENGLRRGGGLCIDPSGLILTVAHLVTIPSLNQEKCKIRARAYEDDSLDYRTVRLVDKFPQFDLALLQVSKAKDEELDFLSFGEMVNVDACAGVFGFVHHNNLLYSGRSGYTNYPFIHAPLPDILDRTTMESSGLLNIRRINFNFEEHYRIVAGVVDKLDVEFHNMHPKLPLVQVSGFGKDPGCSGCPLFRNGSGELIGLFSIQKSGFHFIIPQSFLKVFVDHVRVMHGC